MLWTTIGLVTALLLIGGSLAALNREVLQSGTWHSYDATEPSESIVLAPGWADAAAGGTSRSSDGRAKRTADPDSPVERLGSTPRVTVRPGRTGATAAPVETAATEVASRRAGGAIGTPRREDVAPAPATNGDADNDGISDRAEARLGTDPQRSDSDGDDLPDGWEVVHGMNPTDRVDATGDADGDGLTARTEYRVRSNPRAADTDANGQPDGADDTDGDDVPNAVEQQLPGMDPTQTDSNADGRPDGADDGDGDGMTNTDELQLGLDPVAPDTDGDGASDGSDPAPDDAAITSAPEDGPAEPTAEVTPPAATDPPAAAEPVDPADTP